jgi:N-methylhydantoinase A/oxoprolinase/acetone carboxylase beta subunit
MAEVAYRVGADIGGTFTDLLLVTENGQAQVVKALTTPEDPSQAVETALRRVITSVEGQRGTLVHGTTLVTNALIQRTGAPTALLTTQGFRDALEIGREHRYELYDLNLEMPKPLVPRELRFDVPERIASDGTVLQELDETYVCRLVGELRDRGIRAIGVVYLNSFRNPEHEKKTAELIEEIAPDMRVSLSSEVQAEIREYQRTSTTVANVYVQEKVSDYLAELQTRARLPGQLLRHAVQRRHRHTRNRRPISGPHAGVRSSGRGPGRSRAGEEGRLPRPALVRYGWHHRQAVRRRPRPATHSQRVRGRPRLPLPTRQRATDPSARH